MKLLFLTLLMSLVVIGLRVSEGHSQPPVLGSVPTSPSLNTAQKAVDTAKALVPYLKPGEVWIMRAPRGEVEVKGAILYQGEVVGVVHFDPQTGAPIPLGYHPRVFEVRVPLETVKAELLKVIKGLKILEGAEYREPEACWAIPFAYQGMLLGHIRIYYDGTRVVPDYRAKEEMEAFSGRRIGPPGPPPGPPGPPPPPPGPAGGPPGPPGPPPPPPRP